MWTYGTYLPVVIISMSICPVLGSVAADWVDTLQDKGKRRKEREEEGKEEKGKEEKGNRRRKVLVKNRIRMTRKEEKEVKWERIDFFE